MGDSSTEVSGSVSFLKEHKQTVKYLAATRLVTRVDPLRDKPHPSRDSDMWGHLAVFPPTEPAGWLWCRLSQLMAAIPVWLCGSVLQ